MKFSWLILALILLTGCAAPTPVAPPPTLTPTPTPRHATATPSLTVTPVPSLTRRPTASPTVTPTATPNPYEPYTIEYLRSRSYGAGQIELSAKTDETKDFKRYGFVYPSDGLKIYGFMDVPKGAGPFPVIILIHGGSNPDSYATLDYTTHYADALASAGYLVLHPNLRNYPPSDNGDNLYRVGWTVDILNLIALVKTGGGQPGALAKADPQRIGLWGHSMGGGIVLHVLAVSQDIKAALLYAPVTGDEKFNFEHFFDRASNPQAKLERQTPALAWFHISPQYFYRDISAAISLHQGREDTVVPVAWSEATCNQLLVAGVNADCLYYDKMKHAFNGMGDKKFMALAEIFFNVYLAGTQKP